MNAIIRGWMKASIVITIILIHFPHTGKEAQLDRILFETKAATHSDQPIELPSDQFNVGEYDLVVYYKTAEWLRYVESQIGTDAFTKAMQEYIAAGSSNILNRVILKRPWKKAPVRTWILFFLI